MEINSVSGLLNGRASGAHDPPAALGSGAPANDDGLRAAGADAGRESPDDARTFAWLRGVDRDRWSASWELLWRRYEASPGSREQRELAARGARWLAYSVRSLRWARVWSALMPYAAAHPERVDPGAMVDAGLRWLSTNPAHASWDAVYATVLRHAGALPPEAHARLVAADLARRARPKVAPLEAAVERPGTVSLAAASTGTLTRIVRAYAMGDAVRGRVVEVLDAGYLVDAGVPVLLRASGLWMQAGDEVEITVLALDAAAGTMRVCGLRPAHRPPDASVVVGLCVEGRVESLGAQGVFVRFDGFRGFLRRASTDGVEPCDYAPGQAVRAVVSAVGGRRIELAPVVAEARAA